LCHNISRGQIWSYYFNKCPNSSKSIIWHTKPTLQFKTWEVYKTVVVKMVLDFSYVESTKINLLNLCDIDTILGLPFILHVLKFVNVLMKFE
jgi:hypothetical protein